MQATLCWRTTVLDHSRYYTILQALSPSIQVDSWPHKPRHCKGGHSGNHSLPHRGVHKLIPGRTVARAWGLSLCCNVRAFGKKIAVKWECNRWEEQTSQWKEINQSKEGIKQQKNRTLQFGAISNRQSILKKILEKSRYSFGISYPVVTFQLQWGYQEAPRMIAGLPAVWQIAATGQQKSQSWQSILRRYQEKTKDTYRFEYRLVNITLEI